MPTIELRPREPDGPSLATFRDLACMTCIVEDSPDNWVTKRLALGPIQRPMVLDQPLAAELWPLIKRFAETGRLPGPTT